MRSRESEFSRQLARSTAGSGHDSVRRMRAVRQAIIHFVVLALLPWGAYMADRFAAAAPQVTAVFGSDLTENAAAVRPASKDVRASAASRRCRGPALPGVVCQQHVLLQAGADLPNHPRCGCAPEIQMIILPEEHPPGTILQPPRFG